MSQGVFAVPAIEETRGAHWTLANEWGFGSLPGRDDFLAYGKALLICAGNEREREWALSYLTAAGAPVDVLTELSAYPAKEDISVVLDSVPTGDLMRRSVVFDAIRTCAADGALSDAELAAISRLAQLLDVPVDRVWILLDQFEIECSVRAQRLALIFPDGRPY